MKKCTGSMNFKYCERSYNLTSENGTATITVTSPMRVNLSILLLASSPPNIKKLDSNICYIVRFI